MEAKKGGRAVLTENTDLLSRLRLRKPRPDPLEIALRKRADSPSPRAATRRATIVFDAGRAGAWTVRLRSGRVTLERGRVARPTVVVRGDREALLDVVEGRVAGVEAFLTGRITVRGNLSLALELDDLLDPAERNPRSPRCHRVTAGGLRTFYLEAGSVTAPKVVLLHGLGATSASFLPTIWELSRDHHVLAVDLPGFGESDKPVRALDAPYFAGWVTSFLDAMGLDRAHLVGNSMGGRIALEVALSAPDRVNKIALLAPSLAWRRYRFGAKLVRLLRPELAVLPLPMLHRLVVVGIRTMFAVPDRVSDGATAGAADEFVRIFATPRGRIAFFHALREIYLEEPHGGTGFWDRLPTLSRPALFIFGGKDPLVPHRFLRHVARAVPTATCEVLDDCGHVPQFEHPAHTSARIRAFFEQV
jgi:pimeloyl-ACP methyl ester carboxylesterase